jgi:Sec-independent protein translocase protein TatA
MQQLGKFIVQMRRISNQVKETMDQAMESAQADLDAEALKKKQAKTTAIPEKAASLDPPPHAEINP